MDIKTEKRIVELYNQGVSYDEIAEDTHVSHFVISRTANKYGLEKRRPRSNNPSRKCYFCGSRVNIAEAKYCPFCGKNIITPKENLIREIQHLYTFEGMLPAGERDKHRECVNKIIDKVKKECEVK